MLTGRGAGGAPTASAVLGDLVDAAKNLVEGRKGATIGTLALKPILAIDDVESQFYLMMEVPDRPGVLHAISGVFAEHGVSIRSMQQRERGDDARLVFVTHKAKESDLRHGAGPASTSSRSTAWKRCSGDGGRGMKRSALARPDRGLPRAPAPSHRRHAGHHAARRQHAGARLAPDRAAPASPGSTSRSKGSARPDRSRTAG
jgi:hypothetical protein